MRLLFHAALAGTSERFSAEAEEEARWQQTPWGRMAVGLMLAQGLGYAMQHLLTAGILASGEGASVWATLLGILLLQGIQCASLIVGGALCGAGRERGWLYGSVVGLANGVIFMLMQRQAGETMTEIALYGQPLLHLAFGALVPLWSAPVWQARPR
ncbi:MAG: hypothetical protein HY040_19550 [Planctomycetes bacterium]|nr:hypothetical protein [Planctomycetota bacterium]